MDDLNILRSFQAVIQRQGSYTLRSFHPTVRGFSGAPFKAFERFRAGIRVVF